MEASPTPATTISRGMVRLMRDIAGRGPTRARTTIGRDHVLVLFQETLTQGERNLVEAGMQARVESVRAGYQDILKPGAEKLIEDTLGRKVTGFMSTNHFDPDLAAELFILDGSVGATTPSDYEGEHSEE